MIVPVVVIAITVVLIIVMKKGRVGSGSSSVSSGGHSVIYSKYFSLSFPTLYLLWILH
jgi:hypothetical protein